MGSWESTPVLLSILNSQQDDFVTDLSSMDEFMRFSYESNDLISSGSRMLKVVIQLFRNSLAKEYLPMIYFLDTNVYQLHLPFCCKIVEQLCGRIDR
jgi:hypothetical protein